jgi:hypothetical protein
VTAAAKKEPPMLVLLAGNDVRKMGGDNGDEERES